MFPRRGSLCVSLLRVSLWCHLGRAREHAGGRWLVEGGVGVDKTKRFRSGEAFLWIRGGIYDRVKSLQLQWITLL